jgi:acyl-CoA reductase-like NAD-dependent aldehyde dehydrogenase
MNSPHLPHFTDFVGGQPVAADRSGAVIDLIAPQTGQTVGTIAESGSIGVDRAVAGASAAFAANRRQATHQRIAWLNDAAQALGKANDEIAALICEDVGKPIRMARFEVRRGAEFLELTAAALTQLGGEMLPLDITAPGAGHIGFARHVPYGVVAGITRSTRRSICWFRKWRRPLPQAMP